jgi:hypothetical protein
VFGDTSTGYAAARVGSLVLRSVMKSSHAWIRRRLRVPVGTGTGSTPRAEGALTTLDVMAVPAATGRRRGSSGDSV